MLSSFRWKCSFAEIVRVPSGSHTTTSASAPTASDPFRDYEAFLNQGVFSTFPHPDHVLADVTPVFDCSAGTTLQFTLTVPYHLLQNLEEEGHHPPPGLPAPHGFLEPFHFHCEYAVRSACPGETSSSATISFIFLGCRVRRRMLALTTAKISSAALGLARSMEASATRSVWGEAAAVASGSGAKES